MRPRGSLEGLRSARSRIARRFDTPLEYPRMSQEFYGQRTRPVYAEYRPGGFTPDANAPNPLQMDATGALLTTGGGGGGSTTITPTVVADPTTKVVSVDSTVGGVQLVAASASRKVLSVFNTSTTTNVYIGPSGLTAGTSAGAGKGFQLPPQTGVQFTVEDSTPQLALYAICAVTETALVSVWEQA